MQRAPLSSSHQKAAAPMNELLFRLEIKGTQFTLREASTREGLDLRCCRSDELAMGYVMNYHLGAQWLFPGGASQRLGTSDQAAKRARSLPRLHGIATLTNYWPCPRNRSATQYRFWTSSGSRVSLHELAIVAAAALNVFLCRCQNRWLSGNLDTWSSVHPPWLGDFVPPEGNGARPKKLTAQVRETMCVIPSFFLEQGFEFYSFHLLSAVPTVPLTLPKTINPFLVVPHYCTHVGRIRPNTGM
ncbi:uncharacterized protein CLUP02_16899 [Colletotrichum lupini]|uniref:Uncharacterized protein n=1 Tax=Colletotrichum lupini TaxID=145971 RepID=A0A9Q8T993_9PEZI|nr:uncharacterized protein CLUP02_16899 [Colletotrichum lupini]UQC91365.1 hypothetical protein CLUP02_16899 [Colletotrichum lupini]